MALVVFYTDSFVAPVAAALQPDSRTRRFFEIAARLPLELQMVLCNRMYGSPRSLILTTHLDPAFRCLARAATWRPAIQS